MRRISRRGRAAGSGVWWRLVGLGDVVLVYLYPIFDDLVLFLIEVAMVLGDDHAWHAGAHLKVVGHLDLWELLEERCEETGLVVHRYYHLSVTVDHQLSRVTAG